MAQYIDKDALAVEIERSCDASYLDIELLTDIIDWLNAHHFDYRGLIEKGLALEAPKNIYKV